jgi:ABC-type transport system involved in multi-copper enzyme maturation permease subunit
MLKMMFGELRKLRRKTLLIPTLIGVALLTAFFTSFVFLRVQTGKPNGARGVLITNEFLSGKNGLVYSFQIMGFFLGIVALCVFASQTAQEYSLGTLRNILVRQPSRIKVLLGKYFAMALFTIWLEVTAALFALSISFALAPRSAISTSAWLTAPGFQLLGETFVNIFLGTLAFGTLGMILGLVFRSPITSISIGVLWCLILENILGAVISSTTKWLPGANFANISQGGTTIISYQRSLATSGIYLGLGAIAAAILFKKRDVSN